MKSIIFFACAVGLLVQIHCAPAQGSQGVGPQETSQVQAVEEDQILIDDGEDRAIYAESSFKVCRNCMYFTRSDFVSQLSVCQSQLLTTPLISKIYILTFWFLTLDCDFKWQTLQRNLWEEGFWSPNGTEVFLQL